MTAIGVLHAFTSTLDALCLNRRSTSNVSTAAADTSESATPAVEMACLRCGETVKATFPPDEGEGLAFECTCCGGVARWV
jgi:hypothetical protein